MAGPKHIWTYEEDLLCCRKYLEIVKSGSRGMGISEVAERISIFVPNVKMGSLRMKISNIKALSDDEGLSDGMAIAPLANYSQQNERAFKQALREIGRPVRSDRGKDYRPKPLPPAPPPISPVILRKNDIVTHKKYGRGIVKDCQKDRVKIEFEVDQICRDFAYPQVMNFIRIEE